MNKFDLYRRCERMVDQCRDHPEWEAATDRYINLARTAHRGMGVEFATLEQRLFAQRQARSATILGRLRMERHA